MFQKWKNFFLSIRILQYYLLLKSQHFPLVYLDKVERVSPFRANIIVRVYQVRHYKYDFGSIYNLYGADCYVKNWFKWYTENNGELFSLNHSKNCIRHWLYPDEYIDFNTEFIDIYLRGKLLSPNTVSSKLTKMAHKINYFQFICSLFFFNYLYIFYCYNYFIMIIFKWL